MSEDLPTRDPIEDSAEAQRVTWVGAGVNLVLSILKIIVGIFGHSAALLADGIHSLSDLASDTLVIVVARTGAQPADEDHPYGHARFETAATVVLGLMLAAVAVGIAWDAIQRSMRADELLIPSVLAIVIATLSLASKEWLYQYTIRVANRIHSRLLHANAWHHRTDAISSFVVLIGIAGAMVGYPILDAIAAFIVALMIAHIAWELISTSVKELVDTAVDDETQQQIVDLISNTDGVVNLHMLRTRMMGANVLVDAHIQVEPRLSVSEGHQIAETVEYLLKNRVAHMQDVTIHIDPEDDEQSSPNRYLPLRNRLLEELEPAWSHIPAAEQISKIDLHYLDGKVEVTILLPLPGGELFSITLQEVVFTLFTPNDHLEAIIGTHMAANLQQHDVIEFILLVTLVLPHIIQLGGVVGVGQEAAATGRLGKVLQTKLIGQRNLWFAAAPGKAIQTGAVDPAFSFRQGLGQVHGTQGPEQAVISTGFLGNDRHGFLAL